MPETGAASAAFEPVLCFGGGDCLPLHVVRPVQTSRTQRLDVIDDMAGAFAAPQAGRGAGVGALEGENGGG